ncbi:EAL domain-containing protein [uncultured Thiohalocapsa sp.]|uniref:EAL domain-containing protein n=1 Tax=uncultured Thiohalocapsa sp. TaxID=768990 RepID=UPI0025D7C443|nr:EAL domain-containing protein [uncultured Thiohalocapsa sp.]
MSTSRAGSATDAAVERRRVRGWLLIAGTLVLAIAVFNVEHGVRLAQLEHALAAERTANAVAAQLALALHREESRVHQLLDAELAVLAALSAGTDTEAQVETVAARLREQFPDLLALRAAQAAPPQTRSAAAGVTTELVAHHPAAASMDAASQAPRPVLAHQVQVRGTPLMMHRRSEELLQATAPAWAQVRLMQDGRSWPLATQPAAQAAPAADAPATAMAAQPEPAVTASAPIPHPGAAGWQVAVHRPWGLATLPSLLPSVVASVLLVGLTAAGGLRLWRWSRRREKGLLREQHRLTANQRKLEAVLDSTTDGIVMLDAQHRIELLNPAAEVMFGRLEADVLGTPITGLLPELPMPASLDSHAPLPAVYDAQALRAGVDRFPTRIAERRLVLDDGPRRLLLVQDLTEQERQAEQMAYLEQRDVITGLLNRSEFERRMARLLAEAAGSETSHVLCYIDIDQFKVINDTAGHAAGDALIGQLAKIIEVKLRVAVLVGRLGGDEFGALFADCTEAEALAVCEDLMQTVRNFLFTWREHSYDVAVSIGLTAFLPEHESPEAELAKADVACHMAKHEGRDRVHVYSDSDVSLIRHHGEMHLVSAITQALSTGRFRLYAQPIIPLAGAEPGGGRTHYEILVRMLDEHGELVAPDAFIPAAERYILMPAVDRWIIHQLFSTQHERMRRWHREHPGQFLFAVNLSGTSVSDEGFLPYLRRQFEVHEVPPAAICFEVTETAAMRNLAQARRFIGSLAALGCSFALDDFGSGLSSYGYLRELPVSYLKIDGSFVRDMHNDPVNYALVASINQVAHVLGLKTIAEWAENEFIINQLRALNVDFVQGFAIGTPLPVVGCDADFTADMLATARPADDAAAAADAQGADDSDTGPMTLADTGAGIGAGREPPAATGSTGSNSHG